MRIKRIVLICILLLRPLYGDTSLVIDNSETKIPLSLIKETKTAIQRGTDFLIGEQMGDGSWLKSPAITALVCMALYKSQSTKLNTTTSKVIQLGRSFILNNVQQNGAIASDNRYINYSTSICLASLAIMANKNDFEIMRNARHFLINSQITEERLIQLKKEYKNFTDNKNFIGGIGYGSEGPTAPDLSNTQWALEALYLTEFLDTENYGASKQDIDKSKLAWKNALLFLRKVQNIPKSSESIWVVSDEKYDGGFIYQPGSSKASGTIDNKLGENNIGLRAYGSMTYAGLKSMIYANLDKDDFRVKAAIEWGKRHYTVDENPNMGAEGYFYYLLTLSKALSVYGSETIVSSDGKTHYWKIDVIKKLLNLQNGNGSWDNKKSGRWMEKVPSLVTAYALISLEVICDF